jgi:hypothetical protein
MINPSPKTNTGQKRTVEEVIPIPTLGQVAEQEDFAPLRELIRPVAGRPVNELGEELKVWLKSEAVKIGQLPVALAFLDSCTARVENIATKRAHVAHDGRLLGER